MKQYMTKQWRLIYRDFYENTTIHGVKHLTVTRGLARVLFGVALLVVALMFSFNLAKLCQLYLAEPVTRTYNREAGWFVNPETVLCPSYRVSATGKCINANFMNQTHQPFWKPAVNCTGEEPASLIRNCQYNDLDCERKVTVFEHPYYDSCLVVSLGDSGPRYQTSASRNALRIILAFPEFLLKVKRKFGDQLVEVESKQNTFFHVTFLEQGKVLNYPLELHPNSVKVKPGSVNYIGLKQVHHTRLNTKHDRCTRHENVSLINNFVTMETKFYKYSRESCLSIRRQLLLWQKCACLSQKFPVPASLQHKLTKFAPVFWCSETNDCVNLEKFSDKAILSEKLSEKLRDEDGIEGCYLPCEEDIYQIETEYQFEQPEAKIDKTHFINHEELNSKDLLAFDRNSLQDEKLANFAILEVFPYDLNRATVTESLAYDLLKLVFEFGGICSLYLGMTWYSFLEMIEFFYHSVLFLIFKLRHRNRIPN
ncbi:acid-sensing (proton-gated) ion channel member [Cichlidogyrus casuarinus]|uniref:Acid-sensing (Proton-gated) ion channel member n=1 Tax=Cichlidogyrus casuarinus TaxID=1844966 RepID=A0ABD2QLC7_9PLAT